MEKDITVKIDIKRTKEMLRIEGFDIKDKTDNEVFEMVMDILTPYGIEIRIKD